MKKIDHIAKRYKEKGEKHLKRQTVIREIVDHILTLKLDHPIRVGVSGITASGKTTFANELAEALFHRGQKIIRTSIDDFHNPRAIRYQQGKESAKGYYEDAHDYKSIRERLLIPLGPEGNLHYELKSHDLETDELVSAVPLVASNDAILVVDGTFLFKEELKDLFDYKFFVDTDFDIARKRGSKRETEAFGSYEKAEEMFLSRYHAACHMYIQDYNPKDCADVVVNNNSIDEPIITKNK
ncbi:hypothetical protein ACFDTO_34810 [Microbacteriaceae bacterium 4G12]